MNKILLIDSSFKQDVGFLKILDFLKNTGDKIVYLLKNRNKAKDNYSFGFGPKFNNWFVMLFFAPLLPFFWIKATITLLFIKSKHDIDCLFLMQDNEKIIFSLPARIVKLKVIWFELPDKENKKSKLVNILLKAVSKKVKIVTFTKHGQKKLKDRGFKDEKIVNISLGINISNHEHQDDIFSKIARDTSPVHFKHFTVGVVVRLDERKQIENLFRSLLICKNTIPNLQVIVVGEGKERKNLNWLARKMELDKIVWFVGQQEYLRKWIEGFDLYLMVNNKNELLDFNNSLEAMFCGLPIISFEGSDFVDIVQEGKNGFFIDSSDTENLSQKIILLEQDIIMRKKYGECSKKIVEDSFDINKQINTLKLIMKYEKKD